MKKSRLKINLIVWFLLCTVFAVNFYFRYNHFNPWIRDLIDLGFVLFVSASILWWLVQFIAFRFFKIDHHAIKTKTIGLFVFTIALGTAIYLFFPSRYYRNPIFVSTSKDAFVSGAVIVSERAGEENLYYLELTPSHLPAEVGILYSLGCFGKKPVVYIHAEASEILFEIIECQRSKADRGLSAIRIRGINNNFNESFQKIYGNDSVFQSRVKNLIEEMKRKK